MMAVQLAQHKSMFDIVRAAVGSTNGSAPSGATIQKRQFQPTGSLENDIASLNAMLTF